MSSEYVLNNVIIPKGITLSKTKNNSLVIYILKCEDEKYYVGKTEKISNRIQDHIDGNGSEWTKQYKPLDIVEQIHNCDDFDEDKYTLRYMSDYGIDNVRGGSFSTIVLDDETKTYINRMIRGSTDRCFKCGSNEHFVSECKSNTEDELSMSDDHIDTNIYARSTVICYICKRLGHDAGSCYARYDSRGKIIPQERKTCCYKCGRIGHWVLSCDHDTDIFGEPCNHITDDIRKLAENVTKGVTAVYNKIGSWFG
jgi:GIY-YIG catalytic domain-containing protein/zinc knuckle protein